MKTTVTVYSVKYCLTDGKIRSFQAERDDDSRCCYSTSAGYGGLFQHVLGKDAALDEVSAVHLAQKMVARKLISLEKKAKQLSQLTFEVVK